MDPNGSLKRNSVLDRNGFRWIGYNALLYRLNMKEYRGYDYFKTSIEAEGMTLNKDPGSLNEFVFYREGYGKMLVSVSIVEDLQKRKYITNRVKDITRVTIENSKKCFGL